MSRSFVHSMSSKIFVNSTIVNDRMIYQIILLIKKLLLIPNYGKRSHSFELNRLQLVGDSCGL